MTLLGRSRKQVEPEYAEEAPQNQKSQQSLSTPEKKHEAGDIEPIIDVVGWRVYQSQKVEDAVEVPRDQYLQAKILSKLLLIEKLATE